MHADVSVWLDNEGKEVSRSSEGFSLAPPSLAGRSRVAAGRKDAIPGLVPLTSPHALIRARLLASVACVRACVQPQEKPAAEAASRLQRQESRRIMRACWSARAVLRWDTRGSQSHALFIAGAHKTSGRAVLFVQRVSFGVFPRTAARARAGAR